MERIYVDNNLNNKDRCGVVGLNDTFRIWCPYNLDINNRDIFIKYGEYTIKEVEEFIINNFWDVKGLSFRDSTVGAPTMNRDKKSEDIVELRHTYLVERKN